MKIPLFSAWGRRTGIVDTLYGAIVAQARSPGFYRELGVPDTIEGRFEMIVLHLALLLGRLEGEVPASRAIGQRVFDRFCQDMDDHYREAGVGDLAVPKKMRRVADAFYGRLVAYRDALARGADELEAAVIRNVAPATPEGARQLAAYFRAASEDLAAQSAADIVSGRLAWPGLDAISRRQQNLSEGLRT